MLPKQPVQVNRRVHIRDAVLREQYDLHVTRPEKIQQPADDGINRAQVGKEGGIDEGWEFRLPAVGRVTH